MSSTNNPKHFCYCNMNEWSKNLLPDTSCSILATLYSPHLSCRLRFFGMRFWLLAWFVAWRWTYCIKATGLLIRSLSQVWFTVIFVFVFTFIIHNYYWDVSLWWGTSTFGVLAARFTLFFLFVCSFDKEDSTSLNCLLASCSHVCHRQCHLVCVGVCVCLPRVCWSFACGSMLFSSRASPCIVALAAEINTQIRPRVLLCSHSAMSEVSVLALNFYFWRRFVSI